MKLDQQIVRASSIKINPSCFFLINVPESFVYCPAVKRCLSSQISLFDAGISRQFFSCAGKNNAACFQNIAARSNMQ